jgi:hypothetical protein
MTLHYWVQLVRSEHHSASSVAGELLSCEASEDEHRQSLGQKYYQTEPVRRQRWSGSSSATKEWVGYSWGKWPRSEDGAAGVASWQARPWGQCSSWTFGTGGDGS